MISATCLSQESWKEGFCITQKGDTLHGKILFKDWVENPADIEFLDAMTQTQHHFGTNDVKYFSFSNGKFDEIYESKTARVTRFATHTVPYGDKRSSVDTVSRFMDLRFKSEVVALYLLSFDVNENHFYILKDNVLTELEYGAVMMSKENSLYKYVNNNYRNQLKKVLSECPTLSVKNIQYEEKSIIKTLKQYHSYCKVPYEILYDNQRKVIVDLGVSITAFYISSELENGLAYPFDVSLRFLAPKRFHNRFVALSIGGSGFNINIGSYFGSDKRAWLPFAYVVFLGPIPGGAGTGVSIKKKLDISLNFLTSALSRPAERLSAFGVKAVVYPFKKLK